MSLTLPKLNDPVLYTYQSAAIALCNQLGLNPYASVDTGGAYSYTVEAWLLVAQEMCKTSRMLQAMRDHGVL